MSVYNWLVEQLGIGSAVSDEYIQVILISSSAILCISIVLLFVNLLVGIVSNTFRK